jgi:glucosamine--fructose-6-phosphate aminotransferase (isomerizing)
VHVDSAELLHFRLNVVPRATLLVMVSQSGESAEIVRVAEKTRELDDPPRVLGVTNGATNSLTRASDLLLDTRAGEETGPSTMTFAASLGRGRDRRVLSGGAVPGVIRDLQEQAETAAWAIEHLLDRPALPDELAALLGDRPHSVILGRGPARAAAEMGALTLKEAVGLPIESLETAQFRHGPLELAGPDLAAIVIATEPETRDLDVGLAGELVDVGAAVLLVVEEGVGPTGAACIELGTLDRALAPAVSIVPVQLLAWKLAVRRGRPPGAYLRATKVTMRE